MSLPMPQGIRYALHHRLYHGIIGAAKLLNEAPARGVHLDGLAVVVGVAVTRFRLYGKQKPTQDTRAGRAADGLAKAIEDCKGIIVETEADVIVFSCFLSFHAYHCTTLSNSVQHFFLCSSKMFHVEHFAMFHALELTAEEPTRLHA